MEPPSASSRPRLNGEHNHRSSSSSSRPILNGDPHHRSSSSRPALNGDSDHRPPPPPPPTQNNHHRPPLPPPPAQNNHHNRPQNHHHPHQINYHEYHQASSSSASLKGCCCCLFLLFSFIILLILAVVLVIILAVKPKKPQFDLQQVGVQYMGITAPNPTSLDPTTTAPSSASLSLTIRMLFTAVNPNKVGIKYGESSFTVMYHGIPLGRATVPGFYQDAHSVRNVEATIAVDRVNLMQANAADLIRDASLNDRVELTVLGDVGAKIRVMNFDSPGVQVTFRILLLLL